MNRGLFEPVHALAPGNHVFQKLTLACGSAPVSCAICCVQLPDLLTRAWAQAGRELFLGAREGDVCIVNDDDERVSAMHVPENVRVVRFGAEGGSLDPSLEPARVPTVCLVL